jgi:hypothetical protein
MWLYALYLTVAWTNPGTVAEIDGHQMTVATTAAHVQLDNFPTLAACQGYLFNLPLTLNGAPMPYTITASSCRKYFAP